MVDQPRQGGEVAGFLMFVTYILRNGLTRRFYIGSTNNISRRLVEHNRGHTKSTKQKGKWCLVYKEVYSTSKEAKQREKQIQHEKDENSPKQ